MSWLFDRLCEVAVADEVEIVVAASTIVPGAHDGSDDFCEVLARAAGVPQLTATVLPRDVPPDSSFGRVLRTVDLDELEFERASEAIAVAVRQQQGLARAALRVRGNSVTLHDVGEGVTAGSANRSRRVVLATDMAGWSEQLREAGGQGLGITIGGTDPAAQVKVQDFVGVVSILDALVTLRMFAFGTLPGHATPAPEREPVALRREV